MILVLTAALYAWRLDTRPIYLGGDEAIFATHAYAIASTGRDIDGQRMPLLFQLEEIGRWYQPILFYLIALILKVAPLAEWSIRIPTVVIGVLDVWLLYAVARRIVPTVSRALLGAAMLALTPAHLIFSRQALDYICPLPFVLGWLWCLLTSIETGSVPLALAGGLLLGVGFYSYIGAWPLMPFYVIVTWIAVRVSRQKVSLSIATTVGFALAMLPLVVWLRWHPGVWQTVVGAYRVYDARRLTLLQGVKDFLNYDGVQERLSVYWDYFNPAYLFFAGGSNLTTSTRRAGVFLLAVAIFLVCGVYALWKERRLTVGIVLLAGLASAPLGATLVDVRYMIQRELLVLAFVVLIATVGAAWMLRHPNRAVRAIAIGLVLSMPVQFAYFYRDYMTAYPLRSLGWFDPADFGDVAEYVISSDRTAAVPAVYFRNDLDDAPPRWRFYAMKLHREDLLGRTRFIDGEQGDVNEAPPGTLLVFYANDPKLSRYVGAGACCSIARTVTNAAGARAAVILRKER